MDATTFEELLDRDGADLARWAPADRAAAMTLLAGSSAARTALATMIEVEAMLRVRVVDDTDAHEAMAARAMRHRQDTPARRLAVRAGWAAAAVAVLTLGIAIGDLAAQHAEEPDHLMAIALDAGGAADVD